jgi:DnaJ-domain-containing protein 1
MTDPAPLNDMHSSITKPLSKKLVEAFREAVRDPSVARTDYAQLIKNEMEAALEEGQPDAASRPDSP